MRLRAFLVLTAAAAAGMTACGPSDDRTPSGDTIAVPAAAIDTATQTITDTTGASVTTGVPGAGTAEAGGMKATGVDTPITRRLQEQQALEDTARPVRPPE